MLHGRNKSVNNQVLAKLNTTFPELNILWLLFGRGDMLQSTNIETSEPQNTQINANAQTQSSVNESAASYGFTEDANLFSIQNRTNTTSGLKTEPIQPQETINSGVKDNNDRLQNIPSSFQDIPNDDGRQISSIIVLYSDGSFETFRPQNS